MTDQNSYDTLGLDESSSFEQIQNARERLLNECDGDRKRMDAIEAAYDAILNERLRLRLEGKIKVPDRIRFAEEAAEKKESQPSSPSPLSKPSWLTELVDTPSRDDVLLPAGIFGALTLVSLAVPSLALALGVGCTIYFLNRKERRFWRSLLLTVLGLSAGLTIGIAVGQLLATSGTVSLGVSEGALVQGIAAILTLIVFWVISSFLR